MVPSNADLSQTHHNAPALVNISQGVSRVATYSYQSTPVRISVTVTLLCNKRTEDDIADEQASGSA